MTTYRITNRASGLDLGTYDAEAASITINQLRSDRDTLRAQLTTSQARVTALESALRDVLAESAAPSNPCDASMYHAVCRAARAALSEAPHAAP